MNVTLYNCCIRNCCTGISDYNHGRPTTVVNFLLLTCTLCIIKKEPHIFVRRKQTSAYKLVQLSSFTGFCWYCSLAVLKYVACLIFFANNDVKNCVIIYFFTAQRRRLICSSVRHQTSSRRHFGLQIVQTATRSITRYRAFFSSGCTVRKSKMWTSCDSASLRNGNAWTSKWSSAWQHSQTVVSTSSLLCGCEGRIFRANDIMCQSDSIFSIAWQL